MVLNFDLRARNSVSNEYGAELCSHANLCLPNIVLNLILELNIQYLPNMAMTFDLRAQYSVSTGVEFISNVDIHYLPNMVLNFDLRSQYSVSLDYFDLRARCPRCTVYGA